MAAPLRFIARSELRPTEPTLVVSPYAIVALAQELLTPEQIAQCWESENAKPLAPGELPRLERRRS